MLFVIGGFRSVLFVSCFKVCCFVIDVLFRAVIDKVRLFRRFFVSFFCHLQKYSNVCLLPSTTKSTHHRDFLRVLEQSRVIFSQAGRARYIMICINPTFTQKIDGTEKPKIPSKFAIRAAQYNEFRCKSVRSWAPNRVPARI